MRVTQNMISNNMLTHLSNSYSKMNTYMDQLTTGKKVNKPSDDPVTVMKGMNYRSEVNRIAQYQRNTGEVHNWMDNSDAALEQATQALQKIRELAVQASSDTYSTEERESIQKEVKEIKQHLIDIVNTKANDKYIFNGTNTSEAPYLRADGNLNLQSNDIVVEVAPDVRIEANVDANEVFGASDGEDNMFQIIDDFMDALINEDNEEAISSHISKLDGRIDKVINARADLGARMNRLELIEDRLADQEIVATQLMSDNEDVDYAKAITDLITQESTHRAALAAGARIIQPSLVDFLR